MRSHTVQKPSNENSRQLISGFFTKKTLIILGCSLLLHCVERPDAPAQPAASSLETALVLAVENNIIPATEQFLAHANQLKSQASTFCMAPSAEALTALQTQWRTTHRSWFALANYRLGPLVDDLIFPPYTFVDSLRLRGTNYLSAVRAETLRDFNGTHTLDLSYFSGKPFQYVGLLALEATVFETTASPPASDPASVLEAFQNQPKKCQTLNALAALLAESATYFNIGWTTDYKNSGAPYETLFLAHQDPSEAPPLTLLLTATQEHLDYLHTRNVVNNSAPLAQSAWQAVEAAILEAESLLDANGSRFSFFNIMKSHGYAMDVEEVQQNIEFALTAIATKNEVDLDAALKLLDGNFKRQIPNGLNVSLGINFSDGD